MYYLVNSCMFYHILDFSFSSYFIALESKLVNQFCEDEHGALIYNRVGNGGSISGSLIHSISSHTSQHLLHMNNKNGQAVSSSTYEASMKDNSINTGQFSQPFILVL